MKSLWYINQHYYVDIRNHNETQNMTAILANTNESNDVCSKATKKLEETPEVEAWQQRSDEPNKAFHAFRLYCYAGPYRSLRDVREALGKEYSYDKQLEKWSGKYDWSERAGAWDFHVENLIQKEYVEDVLHMVERHVQNAREIQEKVFERLMSLDVNALKPAELIRLYGIAVKVERDSWTLKSDLVENKRGCIHFLSSSDKAGGKTSLS